MNISPWVNAELIINRALESHRKFQSERYEKNPKLTTFIICKRKLQVDPRPGHAQRQLQTLYSVQLTETTVQPVSGPGFQLPVTQVSYSCKMTWCNHCTAFTKAFSKLEGEKNSTNRFTEHSEKLSLNASLKTQSSSTNSRWG